MKRASLALAFFLTAIVISPVSLAFLDVKVSERNLCMVAPHEFEINMTNQMESSDFFYVKARGDRSDWAWVDKSVLRLNPGESKTTRISVHPPQEADMGKYTFRALIYSMSNRSVERKRELCFIVFRNYSMRVSNFSLSKEKYKPGEDVQASISIYNDGSKDFKEINYSARLLKNGNTVEKAWTTVGLETEERKDPTLKLALDKYQEPGKYEVRYKVMARGSTFSSDGKELTVSEVTNTEKTQSSKAGVLSSRKRIEIKNLGNSIYRKEITKVINYPVAFLVTAENAAVKRKGMSSVYSWKVRIEPGDSKTLSYEVNFWPVYIILAAVVFLLYRAYLYLQPPTIKKEVMKSEIREDKRIFTISLEINNKFIGEVENVIVEDTVPSVARVIEKFDGMKPSLEKSGEETKVRWNLGEIGSGEERVLHYKIKTLVEAVDYLRLPKASIQGSVKGRDFERKSSEVRVEV